MDDLLDKFNRSFDIDPETTCWVWKKTDSRHRYGEFLINRNVKVRAHRFSYHTFVGDIPEGMFVCHSCDNPPCVNPDHLWVGTARDNTQDMIKKGRYRNGHKKGESRPKRGKYRQRMTVRKPLKRDLNFLRNQEIIRLRNEENLEVEELTRRFNLTIPSIYRILSFNWKPPVDHTSLIRTSKEMFELNREREKLRLTPRDGPWKEQDYYRRSLKKRKL